MKLEFDPVADAPYFEIAPGEVADTREIEPGINADYDSEGHLLGIEVLSVTKRSNYLQLAKQRSVGLSPNKGATSYRVLAGRRCATSGQPPAGCAERWAIYVHSLYSIPTCHQQP